jgi:hypothetical protein
MPAAVAARLVRAEQMHRIGTAAAQRARRREPGDAGTDDDHIGPAPQCTVGRRARRHVAQPMAARWVGADPGNRPFAHPVAAAGRQRRRGEQQRAPRYSWTLPHSSS